MVTYRSRDDSRGAVSSKARQNRGDASPEEPYRALHNCQAAGISLQCGWSGSQQLGTGSIKLRNGSFRTP